MNNWNFRKGLTGKLILQRINCYRDSFGDKCVKWEDASVADLRDFWKELNEHQNKQKDEL